jgi:hypothetical protein
LKEDSGRAPLRMTRVKGDDSREQKFWPPPFFTIPNRHTSQNRY